MFENIENLTYPPIVGQKYLVPCILGKITNVSFPMPLHLYPVIKPSHQDSKYLSQYRTIWENGEKIDEIYYEDNPYETHHWHIDPRFTPGFTIEDVSFLIKCLKRDFDIIGHLNFSDDLPIIRMFGKEYEK